MLSANLSASTTEYVVWKLSTKVVPEFDLDISGVGVGVVGGFGIFCGVFIFSGVVIDLLSFVCFFSCGVVVGDVCEMSGGVFVLLEVLLFGVGVGLSGYVLKKRMVTIPAVISIKITIVFIFMVKIV